MLPHAVHRCGSVTGAYTEAGKKNTDRSTSLLGLEVGQWAWGHPREKVCSIPESPEKPTFSSYSLGNPNIRLDLRERERVRVNRVTVYSYQLLDEQFNCYVEVVTEQQTPIVSRHNVGHFVSKAPFKKGNHELTEFRAQRTMVSRVLSKQFAGCTHRGSYFAKERVSAF